MADYSAVALVSRLALTAVLALALALCACAPLPQREAPPEPPVPAEASKPKQAEPEVTQTEESEPAEPDQSSRPVVSEAAADEPDPEPVQRPQTPDEAAPEPAPEAPMAEKDIAISGQITLNGGNADPEEAVVYFVPAAAGRAGKSEQSGTYDIVTRDKSLSPTVLAVARGSEVRFPNQDPILHNLFSVSAENGFDLGVYGPDEAPAVTFEHPGVVNVYCNVHHDMHAHVLVVDTPFRTRPDSDGTFRLTGLPAGRGELHVWHRQSNRWSRPLELPAAGAFEVALEVTKPRLPPHRDKVGQSYNRRDRDPYR